MHGSLTQLKRIALIRDDILEISMVINRHIIQLSAEFYTHFAYAHFDGTQYNDVFYD